MSTYGNRIPRDSDTGNASEAEFISNILGLGGATPVSTLGQLASIRTPFIFDDFLDPPTLNTSVWTGTATGTTGNDVPVAVVADTAGGEITMASGTGALEAQEVGGAHVAWAPSVMGTLVLEARVKVVGTTEPLDGNFSIGWADAVTFTSGVPHVVGVSSLYTTDLPVEFAGFHYSSLPTSGTLFNSAAATPIGNFIGCKTAKNGTGSLAISSGVAKNSSYKLYKVTVSADGTVTCYIDGAQVYQSAAAAVTLATKLTPYFQVHSQASHENTMTIDYVFVGGQRTQ